MEENAEAVVFLERELHDTVERVIGRQRTYDPETRRANEQAIACVEKLRAMHDTARLLGGKSLESFTRSIATIDGFGAELCRDTCALSLCWQGAGLYGGFIFHWEAREWSIHT
jgi:hypothetical protein